MKSIKLKIVTWAILILATIGIIQLSANDSLSNDTVPPPWGDSIPVFVEVDITANPVTFTLESEPLEDNEPLQKMIELSIEEKDLLNQNLSTLNNSIRDLPDLNVKAKQKWLRAYGIAPLYLEKQYVMWSIIGYVLAMLYLTSMYFVHHLHKYLYWSKKRTWTYLTTVGIGLFVIYAFVKIMHLTIPGYYLWQNVDKLF